MLDLMRQMDLLPAAAVRNRHIDIVGVGTLGSLAALGIAKMLGGQPGATLRLIDGDTVDPVNLPSQVYTIADAQAHTPKVTALADHLTEFAGLQAVTLPCFLDGATVCGLRDIVIAAPDSMDARHTIYYQYVKGQPGVRWYLEARMGAESASIFAVRVHDLTAERDYEHALYSDAEALDLPCTGRAIVYTGLLVAGLLTRHVKRILTGQPVEARLDFDLADLTLLVA